MRQILFRGKVEDSNDWVYGGLVYSPIEKQYYIAEHTGDELQYPVSEESIGQFTGLCDKNGKMIFEGDILICGGCKSVVEFGEWNCGCCGDIYGYEIDRYEINREIIGNIHDNPNLLNKK